MATGTGGATTGGGGAGGGVDVSSGGCSCGVADSPPPLALLTFALENGYVITWLMFDAGNRRPPTTPLMQPVSPPLCKMTGASTCTPFTAPVRWMRNLTVTRPGTKVYSSGRARATQPSTASSFARKRASISSCDSSCPPASFEKSRRTVSGLRQILALPDDLEVGGAQLDGFGLVDGLTPPAARRRCRSVTRARRTHPRAPPRSSRSRPARAERGLRAAGGGGRRPGTCPRPGALRPTAPTRRETSLRARRRAPRRRRRRSLPSLAGSPAAATTGARGAWRDCRQ